MGKICLINPPTTLPSSRDLYFPMALVCLGTVLKEKGFDVEIVDFDLDLRQRARQAAPLHSDWPTFRDDALRRLDETDAEIFGISSICSNYPIALLLAREIKERRPNAKIILGGPQPSAVPVETLKECPWVDVVVIGEGEKTILELVSGEQNIPGIAFRDGDRIVISPKRPLIDDLDSLPFPDFSLVSLPTYLAINPKIPLVEAGRGCPFQCSFCSTSILWERTFRAKTPGRILQEMRRLSRDYGLKSFGLTHDNFTASHRYLSEFCDYFQKHNTDRFIWSASARPDTLTIDRLRSLHSAGCRGLFFGVDTGSERMQKVIHKNMGLNRIPELVKESAALGVETTVSFVVGFPEEEEEDLNQTLSLAYESRRLGALFVRINPLSPLAGTPIESENSSRLLWSPLSRNLSHHPVRGERISDLIGDHRTLFSSFYSVPAAKLDTIHIPSVAVFYEETANHMLPVLEKVFLLTGLNPLELFRLWDGWRNRHYPERTVDGAFIFNTFGQFIRSISSTALRNKIHFRETLNSDLRSSY